jgi:hypothetical protein
MKTSYTTILVAGFSVLIISLLLLYIFIYMFPVLMEEYYNPVFRASSFKTDWLFYAHPFVLSFALSWFWEQYKGLFIGSLFMRSFQLSLAYAAVAMLPVLWLTFSAIDISVIMVLTWLFYGMMQSLIAGLIFAKLSP